MNHFDWPQVIQKQAELGVPFVVLTLAEVKGSVPQVAGAKAVVSAKGLVAGTVGGGRVEAKAIAHAQELLKAETPKRCELLSWNLIRDVGMTCGGLVQIIFEVYSGPAWEIVVFGAGHVAQELVPLLCKMDARVTCIDDREEWLARLPEKSNLRKVSVDDPSSYVANCSPKSFFVLMTRGHGTDTPILSQILRQFDPPYVGVIGSDSKAAVLRKELRQMDFSEEKIKSLYCPMGLPIGDNLPAEIAISISAQLLEVRGRTKDRRLSVQSREAAY